MNDNTPQFSNGSFIVSIPEGKPGKQMVLNETVSVLMADFILYGLHDKTESQFCNKMKNNKYHTVGINTKSNRKILETKTKSIFLTHIN